ncbi:unnamed protein product [Caenorhabditis angaria]|uniref:Sdz-33 F-box domain-containing protein n=1 Tax=Caenorhabditis angaria TaxID=860376 RepID=A0A9P1N344_9PELO|nr:unnamed protein product [Caenorhabditis angaria]
MEPPAKRKKIRKNGRKRKAEEENQIETTGWFDLPFELRIIIIEIMPDTTIYKFAQCSKLCYEEAISSKNYCDTMRIVERRDGGLNSYEIQFAKSWIMWLFQFRDDFRGGTIVKSLKNVMTLCDETNWQVKEDGQLFDVIAKYANEYILKFGRNLKKFELYLGCKAKSHLIRKIQLRNMKKIEKLSVSQTPRQVCMLKYKFVDFDQIKHVKSELKLPATVLSFDQLIQLKAERIHIYVMDLTPKDINQYIKYWRDGKLSANLKSVSIHGGFSEKNKKRKDVEVDLEGLELEKCLKPFREETYISNYNKTQKSSIAIG